MKASKSSPIPAFRPEATPNNRSSRHDRGQPLPSVGIPGRRHAYALSSGIPAPVRSWTSFAILLLLSAAAPAATFFVSSTGSDSNPGTQAQPWQTIQKAAATLSAGDTVLVAPGRYAGTTCAPLNSGTADAPITYRADGAVTNTFTWDIGRSNVIIDGFVHNGAPRLATIRQTARFVTVTNCTAQNGGPADGVFFETPPSTRRVPEAAAQFCTVINCTFQNLTNATAVVVNGIGHLIQGNTFADLYAMDALRLFGSNVVIRGNLFTNVTERIGYGNHPDIMQTFGDNGFWMVDFLFEGNRVVNCPIQLMQMEMTAVTNSRLWGITLRNNVFENSNMQCSIDIANVRFLNNTFYRCSNGSSLLGFAFYDPDTEGWRGAAYGSQVLNNAFVECSGTYSAVPAGADQGPLSAPFLGGGARRGAGYARLAASSAGLSLWGTYSGLSGTVTRGTLYKLAGGDLYQVAVTNFAGGRFTASIPMVEGAGGDSLAVQWGWVNAHALGFRINTTTFPSGEIGGPLVPFAPNPPPDLLADYNFVSAPGGAPIRIFTEPFGINGGDPGFLSAALGDFRLSSTSALRGKGSPAAGVQFDHAGRARSSPPAIGAFEYPGQVGPRAPANFELTPLPR